MNVMVLGANGMAGHMIAAFLESKGYNVFRVTRDVLDVETLRGSSFYLGQPDFIINCIGVLVKDSIDNPSKAILVNSWFPHFLEEFFKDTKIIHLSTDCVFDGKRGYYIESDTPNETNMYGKSKAFGELNNGKDITLRMSIIGTETKPLEKRRGLLNWVINNPNKEIQGWEESIWNGITTYELAKQIHNYMQNPKISGIYHLVPAYTISKAALVYFINEVFESAKKIEFVPGRFENKTLLDTRKEKSVFTEIPDYYSQLVQLREFARSL